MQRLIYTVEVDEEFYGLEFFHGLLDEITREELGCSVIRSKLETTDEVCESGDWEGEE